MQASHLGFVLLTRLYAGEEFEEREEARRNFVRGFGVERNSVELLVQTAEFPKPFFTRAHGVFITPRGGLGALTAVAAPRSYAQALGQRSLALRKYHVDDYPVLLPLEGQECVRSTSGIDAYS